MKVSDIKDFALDPLFKIGICPLLVGERGVGKTELVRQYCQERNFHLIELRLGQLADAGDVLGLADFDRDAKGKIVSSKFFPPAIFNLPKDKPTVLFLDEINRCSPSLLQSIFELILEKRISANGFQLPEGSHVVAAMNPPSDSYNVTDMDDAAWADRFCFIKVENSLEDWITYAKSRKVHPSVSDFISTYPKALQDESKPFEVKASPSPRKWEKFVSPLLKACKKEAIFNELLMGLVGTEHAVAFNTFRSKVQLLTVADVMGNYDSIREKFLEYISATDKNRMDIVANLISGVVEELSSRKTPLTKDEVSNLLNLIVDAPAEFKDELIIPLIEHNTESVLITEETEPLLNTHPALDTIQKQFGIESIEAEIAKLEAMNA